MAVIKYLNDHGLRTLFKRGVRFIFHGTQAEWDALPTAQKTKYNIANITDDSGTDSGIIDVNVTRTGAANDSYIDVKKSGKIVYVNLSPLVTPSTDSIADVSMFNGLPKPVRECRFIALSLENNAALFQVKPDGTLITDGPGSPANKYYWGSFVYLTND